MRCARYIEARRPVKQSWKQRMKKNTKLPNWLFYGVKLPIQAIWYSNWVNVVNMCISLSLTLLFSYPCYWLVQLNIAIHRRHREKEVRDWLKLSTRRAWGSLVRAVHGGNCLFVHSTFLWNGRKSPAKDNEWRAMVQKGQKTKWTLNRWNEKEKKRMQTTRIETIAREMNISMVGVFEISEAHHFFFIIPIFFI